MIASRPNFKINYDILKLIENINHWGVTLYQEALKLIKTKKLLIQGMLFFVTFMIIYLVVDRLNMPYQELIETYGLYLVIINILLNITMSFLSALLMSFSTAMVQIKGSEGKASNFGFLSVVFGILTYGCTSCVIAFFASVGIAFSVIALPLAGLPYKFISLILILIGLFWIRKEIDKPCKVKTTTK